MGSNEEEKIRYVSSFIDECINLMKKGSLPRIGLGSIDKEIREIFEKYIEKWD